MREQKQHSAWGRLACSPDALLTRHEWHWNDEQFNEI